MLKKQHLPRNVAGLVLLCILCSSLLTGCWDRIEVEDRAVVLAMAIDRVQEEEQFKEEEVTHERGHDPRGEKIRVTMQIAVPGRLPLGPSGDGGGGGGEAKPVWVLSTVAHSLEDAFSNMQQQVADRLFFGHLRVIVISEAVARRGLQDINEALRRETEVRRTAWMIVSKKKAAHLMEIAPQLERVPALYLYDMVNHSVINGKLPRSNLGLFWRAVSTPGQEGFLPLVESRSRENVFIAGLAYFRGNRMVGKTNPLQISQVMEVTGVSAAGYSVFFQLPRNRGWVVYQATSRESEIRTFIRNGKPRVRVKVRVEGNLEEKTRDSRVDVTDRETVRKLERIIARDLRVKIRELIRETQRKGSDIFAFGEYVRSEHPGFWRRNIQPGTGWERWYRELPVDIQVRAKLRRIGAEAK
ncbi:spore germination protein [Desmospora sp. 8437]|nr:spore germination protein [Desmospora sp. 8437]